MPDENSISFRIYQGFCQHAKECNMMLDEINRACIPFFKGATEALGHDDKKYVLRMIENAKRGFASYRQLTLPI